MISGRMHLGIFHWVLSWHGRCVRMFRNLLQLHWKICDDANYRKGEISQRALFFFARLLCSRVNGTVFIFCYLQFSTLYCTLSFSPTLRFEGNKIHCSPRDQSLSDLLSLVLICCRPTWDIAAAYVNIYRRHNQSINHLYWPTNEIH